MTPPVRGWRSSLLIGLGLAAVLVLIGTVGYLTSDPSVEADSIQVDPISLVAVPGGTGAVSTHHGPTATATGRAMGFTHDELGAALAASNIAPRLTPAARPEVYGPTLTEQCWGDIQAENVRIATTLPQVGPGQDDLAVRALYYRVLAGDPTGEFVVISLLADTAQARSVGGYARVDATLRWSGQDWQMRVPVTPSMIWPDLAGYTLLGKAR